MEVRKMQQIEDYCSKEFFVVEENEERLENQVIEDLFESVVMVPNR